ncbi:MAG: flavodoxin family protein [Thermotogota bacterium]|nr:flavodoxin family protein [Thermotogota bacterium]
MKILSVLGSPRKDGNTSKLMESYVDGVKSTHTDADITIVYPNEENIKPCLGCNACKGGSPKACIIDDEMKKYYEELNKADVVILATPVYWFNMSSQLKIFIDRMYGLDFKNFPSGKKLVLLMSFGDNDMISSGAVNISNSMKQMAKFLGMDFLLEYGLSSNLSNDEKNIALKDIKEMGMALEL